MNDKEATGADMEKFNQFENQAQERILAAIQSAPRSDLDKAECGLSAKMAAPSDHIDSHIKAVKSLRKEIDETISDVRGLPFGQSRETSLVITKLQESNMWLGMELKRMKDLGYGEDPYPNSKDPSNTVIDPTADSLKF